MDQQAEGPFKRVGVLVNPAGGRMQKSGAAIIKQLKALHRAEYREVEKLEAMSATLREFADSGIDLLVVVAGDGTVHAVLTLLFRDALFSNIPVLSLIPAGTTNMTARDFSIPDRPEKALRRLNAILRGQRKPTCTEKAVLRVENADEAPLYGMFFGAGLVAEAVQYFAVREKRRKLTGEKATASVFIRYLLKLMFTQRGGRNQDGICPAGFKLKTGAETREDLELIFASTLDRLLFGFRPYWGRQTLPMHITSVSREAPGLWRYLVPILFGRGNSAAGDGYFSENLSAIEIEYTGKFVIDGELYTADKNRGAVRLYAHDNITVIDLN